MMTFSPSLSEMCGSFFRNKELIYTLTKREIVARYRGSVLGLFWSFIYPVIMLTVYTFVFSVVFKARWNVGGDSKFEFAMVLFAGLIIFNLFSECINRAPNLILANANYVKKIVFPLEVLPWVTLGSALFHASINLFVWFIFYMFIFGMPHLTLFLLPFIIFPTILFTVGVSWALASLGVFIRDIGQMVTILTTLLMFISPIFYPASALPVKYQKFLNLNPLTPAIEETRNILIWGQGLHWRSCIIYLVMSILIALLGFTCFHKTRKGFADVI